MSNSGSDYDVVSDRELLIRIDERQKNMHSDLAKVFGITDSLRDEQVRLDKEKISRGSITWLVTLVGGCMGVISSIAVLVSKMNT